jgi:RecB family exonuclease
MDLDRLEDLQDVGPDWSVSRLHTIMECGKKYSYKYIEHVEEPVTPPLAFGSAVHKCIYEMHLQNKWDDPFVQRLWNNEWYAAQADVDWEHTNYRKRTFDDKGPKILEAYIAKHKEDQWVSLESRFRFDPGNGLPILRGTLDKVQRLTAGEDIPLEFVGRLAIIDYKTSKNPPEQLMLDVDPQLTIYYQAFKALSLEKGEDPVLAIHWLPGEIVQGKEKTKTMFFTTREPNDKAWEMTSAMLRDGRERVDQEKFDRNIGWACRYCPFKDICLK